MAADIDQSSCLEDFQLLLDRGLSDTLPIWKVHGGIIPFGIGLGVRDEIVHFGGPDRITPGVIGIKEWVLKQVVEEKEKYRAFAFISLSQRQQQDLVQAELMHCNGTALRSFYPLPQSENWHVEQITNAVW